MTQIYYGLLIEPFERISMKNIEIEKRYGSTANIELYL